MPMSQASTTSAQAASQSIRQAVDLLAPLLRESSLNRFSDALWSSSHHHSGSVPSCPSPIVAAWDIVAMWLTGVVTNNLSVEAVVGCSLLLAVHWTLGTVHIQDHSPVWSMNHGTLHPLGIHPSQPLQVLLLGQGLRLKPPHLPNRLKCHVRHRQPIRSLVLRSTRA